MTRCSLRTLFVDNHTDYDKRAHLLSIASFSSSLPTLIKESIFTDCADSMILRSIVCTWRNFFSRVTSDAETHFCPQQMNEGRMKSENPHITVEPSVSHSCDLTYPGGCGIRDACPTFGNGHLWVVGRDVYCYFCWEMKRLTFIKSYFTTRAQLRRRYQIYKLTQIIKLLDLQGNEGSSWCTK